MRMTLSNLRLAILGVAAAFVLGGCRGTTVVAGNLTSLCIVLVLLWSTVRMDRSG